MQGSPATWQSPSRAVLVSLALCRFPKQDRGCGRQESCPLCISARHLCTKFTLQHYPCCLRCLRWTACLRSGSTTARQEAVGAKSVQVTRQALPTRWLTSNHGIKPVRQSARAEGPSHRSWKPRARCLAPALMPVSHQVQAA